MSAVRSTALQSTGSPSVLEGANGITGTGGEAAERIDRPWIPRPFGVSSTDATNPSQVGGPATVRMPLRGAPIGANSQPLAEWHGIVLSVGESHFVAELIGKTGIGVAGSHEEACLPIDEVRASDRDLLSPGAFFRLCVSRESDRSGTWRRSTYVVFRRMPAYRREELEAAKLAARDLVRALRVE